MDREEEERGSVRSGRKGRRGGESVERGGVDRRPPVGLPSTAGRLGRAGRGADRRDRTLRRWEWTSSLERKRSREERWQLWSEGCSHCSDHQHNGCGRDCPALLCYEGGNEVKGWRRSDSVRLM